MSRLHASKDFWVGALRTEGPAFRAAAAELPLDAPVPACPDWTVADLVTHLGRLYLWVGQHVGRGVLTPPDSVRPVGDPPPDADLLDWWDAQFVALLDTFEGLDADLAAWHPMPAPKRASFWLRRVAHDTAVHRWDAQMALGLAEPIEAKLAADGIAEVLDTLLPAGRNKGPTDRFGVVHLVAADIGQEWFVRLRGEGIALLDTATLFDSDEHHTRVLATGTASDVLLALYGRVGFDILEVGGDPALLEALRTG